MGILEHELRKYDLWLEELNTKKEANILFDYVEYCASFVVIFFWLAKQV